MIDPARLGGILAMMPAFASSTAGRSLTEAASTIDLDAHAEGVERIVSDGIDAIATTGSFGEGYALVPEEYRGLVGATVEVVGGRVPVFAGCVGAGARDIVGKIAVAAALGADGVLVGLPNYFPLDVENAVRFYEDVAAAYPDLAILVYHNPLLLRTRIPVDAIEKIAKVPNIVGLKDSHRDPRAFMEMMERTSRELRVFVATGQFAVYASWGAAGTWSYECWMDPWPVTELRDAVQRGDRERATRLTLAMTAAYEGVQPPDVRWRETAAKLAVREAGYCEPGPLRAPFVTIPDDVQARAKERAAAWRGIRNSFSPAAGP